MVWRAFMGSIQKDLPVEAAISHELGEAMGAQPDEIREAHCESSHRAEAPSLQEPPTPYAAETGELRCSDEELDWISRAGAGERQAQSWVVRRVLPVVRKVARILVGNPSDADDAAQQSLLEILSACRAFRGRQGPLLH